MTTIHIPPAALEAGARAIYFAFTEVNIGDGEDRWDRLLPRYRAEYREQARAAFVAMVENWEEAKACEEDDLGPACLILPLPPQEKENG